MKSSSGPAGGSAAKEEAAGGGGESSGGDGISSVGAELGFFSAAVFPGWPFPSHSALRMRMPRLLAAGVTLRA